MPAVTYNVRIDQELRDQAFAVLDDYGLTPSQAIKLFLKQIATTREVPLSFSYHKPNATTVQAMQELDNGGGTLYQNLDELLAKHECVTD